MLGVGLLILLLPTAGSVNALSSYNLHKSATTQPSSLVHTLPPPMIDITEDAKAMGYPDGRKIVRDQQGALYVAYRKKYKVGFHTAYHIFVAKSADNGYSWQILNRGQPIEDVGDQNQRVPAIAIDQQGVIHVVWYGKDGPDFKSDENQIKYVSSTDQGQTWSPWRNIAHVAGYIDQLAWQEHPAIYVDEDNLLYVVWEGYDATHPNRTQIKFLRSVDSGVSWSLWRNVSPSTVNLSRPTLVGDSDDTLYIFAYGRVASRHQIIYSQSTDGGLGWSEWTRLAPTVLEQRHVSAAVDRHGTLHVVWMQEPYSFSSFLPWRNKQNSSERYSEIYSEVYYTSLVRGSTDWRSPTRMQASHDGAQSFPSISVEATDSFNQATREHELLDSVWIVWSESTDGAGSQKMNADSMIYVTRNSGFGWSAPFAITLDGNHLYPSLARVAKQGIVDKHKIVSSSPGTDDVENRGWGSMDLVWLDSRDEFNTIRFAHLTGLPQPHQNVGTINERMIGVQSMQPLSESLLTIQTMEFSSQAQSWLLQIFWQWQLTRETQTLLFILFAVVGYVLLKFAFLRWFAPIFNQSTGR